PTSSARDFSRRSPRDGWVRPRTWPLQCSSSLRRRRATSRARLCTSTAACTCREFRGSAYRQPDPRAEASAGRNRWSRATPGAGTPGLAPLAPARPLGTILQQKQSLSTTARRLAAPGVFPYNTAPAPPAPAWRHGNVFPQIQFLKHKDHPLMSTVEQQVKAIVAEQLGVKQEQVTNDASFVDDLGADSLDTVELVMALEEEFEIEIPDEDAEKITTVHQAIDYINERRNKS